jgi:pantoate--beta-alanine ligase
MKIINTVKEMQKYADLVRGDGKTIAFVPTMGFLHEGHLSLIKDGKKRADKVIVSIFVNPTQFGPGEDFKSYPRDMNRDLELCQNAGADTVFAPDDKDLYKSDYQTYINLTKLPNHLCGISRPTHFRGVATIVSKLFNIVKPHIAIFGQKDYQQLLVIRQMVCDLNFDIEIIGAPIVREADGLAMSSRNTYLSHEQRHQALCLYNSLKTSQELIKSGMIETSKIIAAAKDIISSQPEAIVDYIRICDPDTLEDVQIIDKPVRMALAVKIGKTRLIDNMMLGAV